MKEKKYYLYLTQEERYQITDALIEKKNFLLRKGIYSDAVDDILMKFAFPKVKKMKIV